MKLAVAMSGGVDSSAAAALLKAEGHELVGFTMQLWNQRRGISVDENGEPLPSRCCSLDDVYDARRVAEELGFPFYVLNLEKEFERDVVQPFVNSYLNGETPIPCVACNSRLKFASLDKLAVSLGCEKVATGHYARVETDESTGRRLLRRGLDSGKDQSYFLFSLTQEQLAAASFPVGHLAKDAVRDLARDLGLTVADKPDSQEICFVPDGDYAAFIERQTETMPRDGAIVNQAGDVLGRHGGVHKFTVGQRKGLGIALAEPMYVLELRSADQTVVVGTRPALERSSLTASQVNWISGEPPAGALRITAQIRHRHRAADATVRAVDATRAAVEFDVPQTAITPGQAVVFYDGETVLGGGWIDG